MRLSLCALARRRLFATGSLKATEFGGSIVRVRGRAAKIMLPRYAPKKPNMGRSFTCGQPAISSASAADQAFISSEILWSLGRARFMQGANYECQPLNAQLHLSFPRSAVTEADARHRRSIRYSPWRISHLGYRIRQQPSATHSQSALAWCGRGRDRLPSKRYRFRSTLSAPDTRTPISRLPRQHRAKAATCAPRLPGLGIRLLFAGFSDCRRP